MELTPPEQVIVDKLDKDLPHTATIKRIFENQEVMIKGFEDEREFNKSEFGKGTEKFREIFGELKEVKSEQKELRSEVSDMKSQIVESIDGLKNQIAKKELTDIVDEVKLLRTEKKDKAKNTDKLIYGAIGTAISLILYNLPSIVSFIVEALKASAK